MKDRLPFELKSPQLIKQELDKYVIGQEHVKEILSVQVFNSMMRHINAADNDGKPDFERSNVLLFGGTGVGKTYIVEKLAEIVDLPYVCVDCSQLSKTGYVGGSLKDSFSELHSVMQGRAEKYLKEEEEKFAKEIEESNKQAVPIYTNSPNLDSILFSQREYEWKQETPNRMDKYKAVKKATKDFSKIAIIQLDEIDKLRKCSSESGKDVVGGVQMELLRPLQGCFVENGLNTSNFLFICSGAFADLDGLKDVTTKGMGFTEEPGDTVTKGSYKNITDDSLIEYGMMSELIGRLHIRSCLNDLTEDDLYKIMKNGKESVATQFINQFKSFGVGLRFTDGALKVVAREAVAMKLGARSLRTLFEKVLTELSYTLPTTLPKAEVVIDSKYVEKMIGDTDGHE